MKPEHLLISIVLFSAIIVTGIGMVVDFNGHYHTTLTTEEFGPEYNQINASYNTANSMYSQVDKNIASDNTVNSMFQGAYGAMRLLWNSPKIVLSIGNSIVTNLGIPPYFLWVGLTCLIISLVFAIIYLVLRMY